MNCEWVHRCKFTKFLTFDSMFVIFYFPGDDLLKNAGTVQTNGQSEQRAPLLPRENRGAYPDGGEGLLADDMAFYEPELSKSKEDEQESLVLSLSL